MLLNEAFTRERYMYSMRGAIRETIATVSLQLGLITTSSTSSSPPPPAHVGAVRWLSHVHMHASPMPALAFSHHFNDFNDFVRIPAAVPSGTAPRLAPAVSGVLCELLHILI